MNLRENKVDTLSVRNTDMKQRRVVNAAASREPNDYVIRAELDLAILDILNQFPIFPSSIALIRQCTQATIPTDVKIGDIIWVTDKNHLLIKTVSGWSWGPGDQGSNYFAYFREAPTAVGWILCDGAVVKYLKSDGTLSGNVTLPDAVSPFYFRADDTTYSGPSVTPATLPTVDNPTSTGGPDVTLTLTVTSGSPNAATQNHTHTVADPSVSLSGDPIPYIKALLYFRV